MEVSFSQKGDATQEAEPPGGWMVVRVVLPFLSVHSRVPGMVIGQELM